MDTEKKAIQNDYIGFIKPIWTKERERFKNKEYQKKIRIFA
jgi:hypothetical protein